MELTKQQLKEEQELKAKHGKTFTLKIPIGDEDSDNFAVVFLRKLDRNVYSTVTKLMDKDELLGAESMLKSLYIGGDKIELITEDFDALRSAANSLLPIVSVRAGELKKN